MAPPSSHNPPDTHTHEMHILIETQIVFRKLMLTTLVLHCKQLKNILRFTINSHSVCLQFPKQNLTQSRHSTHTQCKVCGDAYHIFSRKIKMSVVLL